MAAIPSSLVADVFRARSALADHDRRLGALEAEHAAQLNGHNNELRDGIAAVRELARALGGLERIAAGEPPVVVAAEPTARDATARDVEDRSQTASALAGSSELQAAARRLVANLARLDERFVKGEIAPLTSKLAAWLARIEQRLAADLTQLERRFCDRVVRLPVLDPATGLPRGRGRPKGSKSRRPARLDAEGNPLPRQRHYDAEGRLIPLGRPKGAKGKRRRADAGQPRPGASPQAAPGPPLAAADERDGYLDLAKIVRRDKPDLLDAFL